MSRLDEIQERGQATEHRVELDQGWILDRKTGAVTTIDGLRIRWRFVGERRWRKKFLVPDADAGQTLDSLAKEMDAIVDALARAVLAGGDEPGGGSGE